MKPSHRALLALVLSVLLVAGCAGNKSRKEAAAVPPPAAAAEALDFTLAGDALFAFGRSGIEDIAPEGRAQLDEFARKLQGAPYGLVRVIGHSDRIGDARANLRLSEKRARAVLDYLVQAGVPADKIISSGRGSAQPVAACESERGDALKACLAPNRRVEVLVEP